MRYTTLLPFVAVATKAFVVPDEAMAQELRLEEKQPEETRSGSWWDKLPSFDKVHTAVEDTVNDIAHDVADIFDAVANKFDDMVPDMEEIDTEFHDFLDTEGPGKPPHKKPKGPKRHPRHFNLTIYEAIKKSNATTKFAALVDKFDDIVQLLNSTEVNSTVLVPTDKAFEKIPEHHKKPSKEFVEAVVKYHIIPGFYPAGRVFHSHTLPTLYKEPGLGDQPQRLRVSFGFLGLKINVYSKVIIPDIVFTNGIVHGVNAILVPPPSVPKIIKLFPSEFSTLELGLEHSGLLEELSHATFYGSTFFTPSNWAFKKLGARANAFLFNTEKGSKFLNALLKYHIAPNQTLYTDAFYGPKSEPADPETNSHYHVDLPTLLGDKTLPVDISSWGPLIDLKVNGHVKVVIKDGIASDGVIQIVPSILIPPHKHKGAFNGEEEIEVEDLIERLEPYVTDNVKESLEVGEL